MVLVLEDTIIITIKQNEEYIYNLPFVTPITRLNSRGRAVALARSTFIIMYAYFALGPIHAAVQDQSC